MTSQEPTQVQALPENPDLRHLKDQARDLMRSGVVNKLSTAQYRIARSYGFSSWPKLKAHVESLGRTGELKSAIDANDLAGVQRLMTLYPDLHRAPLGYGKNGPLTWATECRVPRQAPGEARLAIVRWMLEHGSDIHQGGDGPLMRAALDDERIAMMDLLVEYGADVNAQWSGYYPIVCAPCETLAPTALRWLFEHGADPRQVSSKYGSPLSMVFGNYLRLPVRKHACLEAFIEAGFTLPDTPAIAFHRGRIDLLEHFLERDGALINRRFPIAETFPPETGVDSDGGFTFTPIQGVTLLHLAMEYDELEIARLLLERGADVNARAEVDSEGFGGQTPLFHCVFSMGQGSDAKAKLLLDHGADPNRRTTLRKQLRHMDDPDLEQMCEFHDVTPTGCARQYLMPDWVNEPALAAIAAAGGR